MASSAPQDFATQAELVGPGGVGLLVYGSGIHWGTAYLGPDGLAPDSAGTLAATPVPEPPRGPGPQERPAAGLAPGPEVADIAAGESLAPEPLPAGAGPRRQQRRARRREAGQAGAAAPVRVGTREGGGQARGPGVRPGPETPGDVQFVVGALIAVIVAAAIIIGVLVHSAIVAVIIAVIGLLVAVRLVTRLVLPRRLGSRRLRGRRARRMSGANSLNSPRGQ